MDLLIVEVGKMPTNNGLAAERVLMMHPRFLYCKQIGWSSQRLGGCAVELESAEFRANCYDDALPSLALADMFRESIAGAANAAAESRVTQDSLEKAGRCLPSLILTGLGDGRKDAAAVSESPADRLEDLSELAQAKWSFDVSISARSDNQARLIDPPAGYTREFDADGQAFFRDAVGLRVNVRGNVSPEFQQRMLEQIQRLPEADRRRLADAGINIMIAGWVTDADPSLTGQQPRNWPDGSTYDDTDGIYLADLEPRSVVVAERTSRGLNRRAEGTLRHEVGHAINDALGMFSNSREFMQAYEADRRGLTRGLLNRLDYWLRGDGAGPDETFADIYAALRGGVPNREQTRLILNAFPRVRELVRRLLGA